MQFIKSIFIIFFSVSMFSFSQEEADPAPKKRPDFVLVFTKTEGYRHESIATGVKALRELGRQNNFIVIRTESAEDFTERNLKNYQLVVFLSTTGNVLDSEEQNAFENYIKSGGGYLGIHAAADTEYDWLWYGKLVGGYFDSHPNNPNVRKATVQRIDKQHISTIHLPDSWVRNDEWYNYKNLNSDMTVALNLDETSYEGGTNGQNHPIAWYHEVEQGRSYYTGGGHTNESFANPDFRQHLLGAITWCLKR
ncbi:ThuA domain-containing protein [Croceitalea rosinachiae]|uniref:ThuA domain-containing protein n=1 Tax=Croceitalea rosinachiae TaxID=3075596 RepID=A0ABU3A9B9_9FLAO|nr:ThuA domain-containing protein [Croceitalea sp. F388]MDT0606122.1 ThuA domain-containing protein [Croceitalea sp. F388]